MHNKIKIWQVQSKDKALGVKESALKRCPRCGKFDIFNLDPFGEPCDCNRAVMIRTKRAKDNGGLDKYESFYLWELRILREVGIHD